MMQCKDVNPTFASLLEAWTKEDFVFSIDSGITFSTSSIAVSFRTPLGFPLESLTIRPPGRLTVRLSIPARDRAAELATATWPQIRFRKTGFEVARSKSSLVGYRCSRSLSSSHPLPSTQVSWDPVVFHPFTRFLTSSIDRERERSRVRRSIP